jgi:hypothetical protein
MDPGSQREIMERRIDPERLNLNLTADITKETVKRQTRLVYVSRSGSLPYKSTRSPVFSFSTFVSLSKALSLSL